MAALTGFKRFTRSIRDKANRIPVQVTSAYVSPCILNMVADDADIVLIEFTFNDSVNTFFPRLEENAS